MPINIAGLGPTVTFAENTVNAGPQLLDPSVNVSAFPGFAIPRLTVSGLLAQDRVGVFAGDGLTVAGNALRLNGVGIGTFSGGVGTTFEVAFGLGADAAAVNAVVRRLTYANVSDTPGEARSLLLQLVDPVGGVGAAAIAVRVTPENDAPRITSPALVAALEGSTSVFHRARATDPDGDAVTWSLLGPDAALFAIDPATGEIRLRAAADFESPADADGDNRYQITLRASDGQAQAARDITVEMRNVLEPLSLTGLPATLRFVESDVNAAPRALAGAVTVTAGESLAGGRLSVTGLLPEDRLTLSSPAGSPRPVTVEGAEVRFGGAPVGALTVGPSSLSVDFGAGATAAAAEAVIEALRYANVSDTPTAQRTLTLRLFDGSGQAPAGAPDGVPIVVNVSASDDAPRFLIDVATIVVPENAGDYAITYTPPRADPDGGPVQTMRVSLASIDSGRGAGGFPRVGDTAIALPSYDFEDPRDRDRDNVYEITLASTPFAGVGNTMLLRVVVTDVPDTAPVLSGLLWDRSFPEAALLGAPVPLDADVTLAHTAGFAGGSLVVGGLAPGDVVGLADGGGGPGAVGLDGATVTFGGADVGRLSAPSAGSVRIDFTGGATRAAVEAVIEALTFSVAAPDAPWLRNLTLTLTDAFGFAAQRGGVVAVEAAERAEIRENATGVVLRADAAPVPGAFALAGADAARFSIDAATGVVSLDRALDFEAPADDGRDNLYDFDVLFTPTGGGATFSKPVQVAVLDRGGVSWNPTAGIGEFPVFRESALPQRLFPGAVVASEESFAGGRLVIGGLAPTDRLLFAAGGPVSFTTPFAPRDFVYKGAVVGTRTELGDTYVYTFFEGADAEAVQAVMRSISLVVTTFQPTAARALSLSLTNGAGEAAPAARMWPVVVDTNTPPEFFNTPTTTVFWNENTPLAFSVSVVDRDAVPQQPTITLGGPDAERFAFSTSVVTVGDPRPGVVQAAVTSANLALREAADFEAPNDADGDGVYEITLFAADGDREAGGDVVAQSIRIAVRDVAEPVVLSGVARSLTVAAGAPAQSLDADVSVNAPGGLAGGRLVVSGLLPGDRVAIADAGGAPGRVGWDGTTVTFGGAAIGTASGGDGAPLAVLFGAGATAEAAEAVVEALVFSSAAAPGTQRSLSLALADGQGRLANTPREQAWTQQPLSGTPLGGLDLGDPPFPPAVGDINGDGRADLVVGQADGTLRVFLGTPGGFAPASGADNPLGAIAVSGPAAPALGDFDRDGRLDLVVSGGDGRLHAFRNTGAAFEPTAAAGPSDPFAGVAPTAGNAHPAFADLDADGRVDLLVATASAVPSAYRNTEAGFVPWPEMTARLPFFARGPIAVEDLNLDGTADLAFSFFDGFLVADGTTLALSFDLAPALSNIRRGAIGDVFGAAFLDADGDGLRDFLLTDGTGAPGLFRNVTPLLPRIEVTLAAANAAPAPGGAPPALPSLAEDTAGVISAADLLAGWTDPEGDPLRVVSLSAASGAVAPDGEGRWSFQPAPDFNGRVAFSYAVSDGTSTVQAGFALDILPVNDLPRASDATLVMTEDTPRAALLPALLAASDPDGDPLVFAVEGGDSLLRVVQTGDTVVFTPLPDRSGSVDLIVSVGDGAGAVARRLLVVVEAVNDAPIASPDGYEVAAGGTLAVGAAGVLANDRDPEGAPLRAALVAGPSHGQLALAEDGGFTYRPDPGFEGEDSFAYAAGDGEAETVATVTLRIFPAPDAGPLARPDLLDGEEDGAISGNVLDNDVGPGGLALSAVLVEGPRHGELALGADGTFTYRPNPDFQGEDGFVYAASNGRGTSAPVGVTLRVAAVNDAPVAPAAGFALDEDGAARFRLPASDADGDELAFEPAGPLPPGMSLAADGALDYAPPPDFNGTVELRYRVTDGRGGAAEGTATILVGAVADAPRDLAIATGGSVAENSPAGTPVARLAAFDPDGDALTFALVGPAGPFALSGDGLVVAGPLDFEATPVVPVTVRATDPSGLSVERRFEIAVLDVPEAGAGTAPGFRFSNGVLGQGPGGPDRGLGGPLVATDVPGLGRLIENTGPWNGVKNAVADAWSPALGTKLTLMNFVDVRLDLDNAGDAPLDVTLVGAKRGAVATAAGNDAVTVVFHDNGGGLGSAVLVTSGGGDDAVQAGTVGSSSLDEALLADNADPRNGTLWNPLYDGRVSTLRADLGDGDDRVSAPEVRLVADGGAGNDRLDGGARADTLWGGEGADSLSGGGGADSLSGGGGADRLEGGAARDTLAGGADADVFVFRSASLGELGDAIVDFQPGLDRIELSGPAFGGLAAGADLAALGRFVANASGNATQRFGQVIYETDTGRLWWDADGTALGARVLVATLSGAPPLSGGDVIIA